jgi:hypothetical protein
LFLPVTTTERLAVAKDAPISALHCVGDSSL